MKKFFFVLPVLFLAMLLFVGCQDKPSIVEPTQIEKINIDNSNSGCTPIFAGQTIEVGTVCLEDDWTTHTLKVTYTVNAPWVITEIHFAVGANSSDIPVTKKGNMIPGQFPYVFTFADGKTTYSFEVPFAACGIDNCDDNEQYFGAAHCVVEKIVDGQIVQTETGWANGSTKPGNSWGEIFGFKVECYDTGDDETGETAFAYGCDYAKCFNDIDTDIKRWGWSNGPLTKKGTYTWDLYAAAGQCDLSKGTIVGTLTVEYDGSTAIVTYNTCGTYKLDEVHLYVGCDPLPKDKDGDYTVAPGQYPKVAENLNGETSYSSKFENLDCPNGIYVVAHAVVVGDYTKGSCEEEGCDFEEACDKWIVYGSNLGTSDAIYAVDLKSPGSVDLVYDPGQIVTSDNNYPNANAYDPDNQRIYFGTNDGRLFYHELGSSTHVQVATGFGTMACASWYNGKYYYVQNGTNQLYEVTITSNVAARIPIGTVPNTQGYGDIAFDPSHPGWFIGCTASGYWYAYNTNDNSTKFALSASGDGATTSKQLAFASNGQLYGVDATTGQFYKVVVNYSDKTVALTTDWNSGQPLTDLASGPQCK